MSSYANRSARVSLRFSLPGLGVFAPLLRLTTPPLLEVLALLMSESVGEVCALPRLGLGSANESSMLNS